MGDNRILYVDRDAGTRGLIKDTFDNFDIDTATSYNFEDAQEYDLVITDIWNGAYMPEDELPENAIIYTAWDLDRVEENLREEYLGRVKLLQKGTGTSVLEDLVENTLEPGKQVKIG